MPYEFVKFRSTLCENFKYHYISAIEEENDCYFFDTTEDIVSLGKTRITSLSSSSWVQLPALV